MKFISILWNSTGVYKWKEVTMTWEDGSWNTDVPITKSKFKIEKYSNQTFKSDKSDLNHG